MKIQTYKLLNIIFIVIIVILSVYVITLNIKKQTIINTSSNSENNQTDNSNDTYTRLDTILKNSNFNYEYTYQKFSTIYFSIAEYNEHNFSINEYKVNDGDSININIKANDSFLVSLAGYENWSLTNTGSLKNISLDHTSDIIDWKNDKPEGYMGLVYGRDNFYFSVKSNGDEILQFKYPDGFTLNVNVKIS